jgi:hypothetical protein
MATRVPSGPGWKFAMSYDMVCIQFRGPGGRAAGWPLRIAPENQTEFLRELSDRVPGITVLGAGVREELRRSQA